MTQGIIIKALSGFYYIESDGVIYQTRARGVFLTKGPIATCWRCGGVRE